MPSDPLIGELMLYPGNRAPQGWEPAKGQELQISQNTMLFSIIGATFGGDGRTTFALPDMRNAPPQVEDMVWCIALQGIYPTF